MSTPQTAHDNTQRIGPSERPGWHESSGRGDGLDDRLKRAGTGISSDDTPDTLQVDAYRVHNRPVASPERDEWNEMIGFLQSLLSHTWVARALIIIVFVVWTSRVGLKKLSVFLLVFVLPLGLMVGSAYLFQRPRTFDLLAPHCDSVVKTLSSIVDYGASKDSIKSSRVSAKVAKGDTRGLEGYWSNECVAYSTFRDGDVSFVVNAGDFGTHSFAAGEVWQGGEKLEIPAGAPGAPRLLAAWKSGTAVVMDYQFARGRMWVGVQATFADPTKYSLSQATAKTIQVAADMNRHMPETRDLDVDRQFRDDLAWVWAGWIVVLALVPTLLAPFMAGLKITKWKWMALVLGIANRVSGAQKAPLPGASLVRTARLVRLAHSGGAFVTAIAWGGTTFALLRVLPARFSILVTALVIAVIFLPVEVLRTAILGTTRRYRFLRPHSAAAWTRVLLLALVDSVFVGGVMYAAARLAVAWMMVPLAAANNGGSWSALIWAVLFGPVVLLLVSFLLQLARTLRTRTVEEVMRRDPRNQVLYLRSFEDDHVRIPIHLSLFNPLSFVFDWHRIEPFEEVLVQTLWRTGPVLAVGRPGEGRSPLGAARLYFPDEAWQDAVTRLVQSSEVVVVTMGKTAGVSWELAQLKRLGALAKTVVLLPPTGDELTRVRLLAKELDLEDVWSRNDSLLVPTAFWFDLRDQPHALYADVLDDVAYEVSVAHAIRSVETEAVAQR